MGDRNDMDRCRVHARATGSGSSFRVDSDEEAGMKRDDALFANGFDP